MKKFLMLSAAVFSLAFLAGCSEKIDENKSIEEVRAEALELNVSALKSKVAACEEFLAEKRGELDKVAAQIKEIPLTEMFSENAKKLKDEAAGITKSIDKVTAQMKVYADAAADKLKEAAK